MSVQSGNSFELALPVFELRSSGRRGAVDARACRRSQAKARQPAPTAPRPSVVGAPFSSRSVVRACYAPGPAQATLALKLLHCRRRVERRERPRSRANTNEDLGVEFELLSHLALPALLLTTLARKVLRYQPVELSQRRGLVQEEERTADDTQPTLIDLRLRPRAGTSPPLPTFVIVFGPAPARDSRMLPTWRADSDCDWCPTSFGLLVIGSGP